LYPTNNPHPHFHRTPTGDPATRAAVTAATAGGATYRDPTAAYNHHSNGGLGAVYQPAGIG